MAILETFHLPRSASESVYPSSIVSEKMFSVAIFTAHKRGPPSLLTFPVMVEGMSAANSSFCRLFTTSKQVAIAVSFGGKNSRVKCLIYVLWLNMKQFLGMRIAVIKMTNPVGTETPTAAKNV